MRIKMKKAALLIALLFLIVGTQGCVDRTSATAISEILKSPEDFEGKEVIVEGIFTDSVSFSWVRGDLWGIDDGAAITVQIEQNEDLSGREFYDYIDSLYDKKVRVEGEVAIARDTYGKNPFLIAGVEGIEVIE